MFLLCCWCCSICWLRTVPWALVGPGSWPKKLSTAEPSGGKSWSTHSVIAESWSTHSLIAESSASLKDMPSSWAGGAVAKTPYKLSYAAATQFTSACLFSPFAAPVAAAWRKIRWSSDCRNAHSSTSLLLVERCSPNSFLLEVTRKKGPWSFPLPLFTDLQPPSSFSLFDIGMSISSFVIFIFCWRMDIWYSALSLSWNAFLGSEKPIFAILMILWETRGSRFVVPSTISSKTKWFFLPNCTNWLHKRW